MIPPVLELTGITKRFGAITANYKVNLSLAEGEILALLGENGAGKTTLMNILFGHYVADEGEVRVRGRLLPPGRPGDALKAGVGMVHQHFALAGNLSVLENIIIGSEPLWRLRSDRRGAGRLARLMERFGLQVDPDRYVRDLSVGERQRVEILKALYRGAGTLILDEPTAVLARPEVERLFETLHGMTAQGLSLIFISHKLHEVMAVSHRVAVMRAGHVVAERPTSETTTGELAELMVGRRITRPVREPRTPGDPVVTGREVTLEEAGLVSLRDASFEVRAGEILGIVGVSGNGQTALSRLLNGLARATRGTVELGGVDISGMSPRELVRAGVARIPEDRNAEGVVGEMSMWENAILERLRDPEYSRLGFVKREAARAFADELIRRFDVRGAGADTRTRLLSGGNVQKFILARNLVNRPTFCLANQPTRGLDEGAIAAVHGELLAARRQGTAVLLISEDLDEVLALADRIQAIVKGRLSEAIRAEQADSRTVGLMMAGVWEAAA